MDNLPIDDKSKSRYTVKYYTDEIGIIQSKCLVPDNCTCRYKENNNQIKCEYTAEEIKAFVENYYRQRADYIQRQTTNNFLKDMGIYIE